jgi:hypothetical protein
LNSNYFYTTIGTTSTQVWEKFIFENNGTGQHNGDIFIEFWLFSYGNCPTGWHPYGFGDCWKNRPRTTYGYINPGLLTYYTLTGSVSSATDTVKLCYTTTGNCFAASDSDRVNLYSSNWWGSELNVFGWGGASQANFNAGTSLGLTVNNFANGQACGSGSTTGETNNLNLGSCNHYSQYITFTES